MAVFSSDLPHVNKKYLRLCGLILTIGTVCGRFNFDFFGAPCIFGSV